MLCIPSGALLIDTPGLRELKLWTADESFEETFADNKGRIYSLQRTGAWLELP
jgi:putative ribosome biogenesis GTPase RsgA